MSIPNTITSTIKKVPRISHTWIFGLLIFGFLCKSIGAAWDVAYHFKHFREFLQIPHILNAFGDAVIVCLLVYLWVREPKQDRKSFKIMIYGVVVFILSIGLDQWSHETYGIDLTTWSISHFALYTGTIICIFGALQYIFRDFHHSRISVSMKKFIGMIFSYFILESFWFPLIHQEQGVIMDYYLKRGVQLADDELLQMFFKTSNDVYGGLPMWLYGVWVIFIAMFVFNLVKRLDLHKYGATIVAFIYVLERTIMNGIFSSVNYPLSTVPYFLVVLAIVFDVVYNSAKKDSLAKVIKVCLVPIVVVLLLGSIETAFPMHPPIDMYLTFVYGIPAAIVGYAVSSFVYRKLFERYCR